MRFAAPLVCAVLTLACVKEDLPTHTETIEPSATSTPYAHPHPHPKKHSSSGPDRDGDGIPDDVDKCPDEVEDYDGFQDSDGCPEPDNDQDGVLDMNDKCPNVPGPASSGGCPAGPSGDRDGDGISDANDACPDDPEDKDGFEDNDGCPDPDNDKDGTPDVQDKCPNNPGPPAKGGCP